MRHLLSRAQASDRGCLRGRGVLEELAPVGASAVGGVGCGEGSKGVESQASLLDNLRSRASTILAAASLVSSFLGGQALIKATLVNGTVSQPAIGTLGWLATAAFVGVLIATLTLWPRDMAAAITRRSAHPCQHRTGSHSPHI